MPLEPLRLRDTILAQFSLALACSSGGYGRGDPRDMIPVRQAGAEVTSAFWASLGESKVAKPPNY
jgi:hypothetical protein